MKEGSSVKQVSTRRYFFVPSTFEPINGTITFGPRNLNQITLLYDDALVLELKVARFQVCKILINLGNSLNLIHVLVIRSHLVYYEFGPQTGVINKIYNLYHHALR